MSRKRAPSGEELALWKLVTDSVKPLVLPKRKPAAKPTSPEPPAKPAKSKPAPPPSATVPVVAKKPATPPKPPALNPIDRRTRSKITRGSIAIDRRIDLHGMTQAAAEQRLKRFLVDAQAEGAKVVLVITGKGKPGRSFDEGGERGVLRRVVPMWLSSPSLRSVVVGFDEAAQPHGGGGALYVRIRRLR